MPLAPERKGESESVLWHTIDAALGGVSPFHPHQLVPGGVQVVPGAACAEVPWQQRSGRLHWRGLVPTSLQGIFCELLVNEAVLWWWGL